MFEIIFSSKNCIGSFKLNSLKKAKARLDTFNPESYTIAKILRTDRPFSPKSYKVLEMRNAVHWSYFCGPRTWKTRLEIAKINGLTEEDKRLASQWNTCAIGEQYGVSYDTNIDARRAITSKLKFSESKYSESTDYNIDLGDNFMTAVRQDDVDEAIRLYDLICKEAKKVCRK